MRSNGKVDTPTGQTPYEGHDQNFCLFFYPDCPHTILNVLPDFVPPGSVEIESITVKGVPRKNFARDNFQIELDESDLGGQIVVEFRPTAKPRPPAGRP